MVIVSVQGIVTISTVMEQQFYILHRSRARTCPQLVDPATLINNKLHPTRLVPPKCSKLKLEFQTLEMTLLPRWNNI